MSSSVSAIATSVIRVAAIINILAMIIDKGMIPAMVSPCGNRKEPNERRTRHHPASNHPRGKRASGSRFAARPGVVAFKRRAALGVAAASRRARLHGRARARGEGSRGKAYRARAGAPAGRAGPPPVWGAAVSPAARLPTGERRPWLALAVLCLGQLMIARDATIAHVAVPAVQREPH